MKNLLSKILVSVVLVVVFVLSFVFLIDDITKNVFASQYQQCQSGKTCVIGEFLYNDSYVPITDATCTYSAKNPDGTTYLDNELLVGTSDGWYAHQLSASEKPLGLYRGQICCTTGPDNLCLDKSFELVSAPVLNSDQIGTAVWTHPDRELTSFSTLVSDIWSHSSRSLTDFGSIVSSIWSHDNRSITSADLKDGSLATKGDVDSKTQEIIKSQEDQVLGSSTLDQIKSQVDENRLLLEKLVNKPIIETKLEDEDIPNLKLKISQTRQASEDIQVKIQEARTEVSALQKNQSDQTRTALYNKLRQIQGMLGSENSSHESSVMIKAQHIQELWDDNYSATLFNHLSFAQGQLDGLLAEIKTGKPKSMEQSLISVADDLTAIEEVIGLPTDKASISTIYGKMDYLEKTDKELEVIQNDLHSLLQHWGELSTLEQKNKLNALRDQVFENNHFLQAASVLDSVGSVSVRTEKNEALALEAMVTTNRLALAYPANRPVKNLWLEEGSIVYKTIVSNPSSLIEQTVPLKYFLPREVNQEDIIFIDSGLSVNYDIQSETLYVHGEFNLKPEETRVFSVRVNDIWVIPEEEIAALYRQADELFEPLKGTSYFAQGSILKNDIIVSLDKAKRLQKEAYTPDSKIKAFREATIELSSAQNKLDDLKMILSSAGSEGNMYGFIGGIQAVAVWGLIVMFVVGMVFLAIYIRMLAIRSERAIQNGLMSNQQGRSSNGGGGGGYGGSYGGGSDYGTGGERPSVSGFNSSSITNSDNDSKANIESDWNGGFGNQGGNQGENQNPNSNSKKYNRKGKFRPNLDNLQNTPLGYQQSARDGESNSGSFFTEPKDLRNLGQAREFREPTELREPGLIDQLKVILFGRKNHLDRNRLRTSRSSYNQGWQSQFSNSNYANSQQNRARYPEKTQADSVVASFKDKFSLKKAGFMAAGSFGLLIVLFTTIWSVINFSSWGYYVFNQPSELSNSQLTQRQAQERVLGDSHSLPESYSSSETLSQKLLAEKQLLEEVDLQNDSTATSKHSSQSASRTQLERSPHSLAEATSSGVNISLDSSPKLDFTNKLDPTKKWVRVSNTPVDYLNVRQGPAVWHGLVQKVWTDEIYQEIQRQSNSANEEWVEIVIDASTSGWVINKYVEPVSPKENNIEPTSSEANSTYNSKATSTSSNSRTLSDSNQQVGFYGGNSDHKRQIENKEIPGFE
jgi:hypothetical protein